MRRLSTLQQAAGSSERGGRRKLNQNADKSENIVILAYFSVFGVEKGCNVTTFSSLLTFPFMSLAGSGILGIQFLLSRGINMGQTFRVIWIKFILLKLKTENTITK